MTRVMVFGTFDIFHKGHEYFLNEALKRGDELFVVIARDDTVKKIKPKPVLNDENKRLAKIKKLDFVKDAFLGSKTDRLKRIREIKPDIICLGYDQRFMVDELNDAIKKNKWNIEVIRIESFYADKYKSSILREKLEKNNKENLK